MRPAPGRVVVYGWPDTEGNARALARYVADLDGVQVTVLESTPGRCRPVAGVTYVAKGSIRGVLAYLRASRVFFTHGLYGSLPPIGRRTFVNVWHGDGPKRLDNSAFDFKPAADYVCAGTSLWARYKADYFKMPPARVLTVGNPRVDDLFDPADEATLRRLGVRAPRFVVWLPTFRRAQAVVRAAWQDAPSLPAQTIETVAAAFSDEVQLVVKAHPLDADDYAVPGALVVTDDDLAAAGVELYHLLGAADAMITDYSSAWVDFLVLDRPVALFCPDLEAYEAGRGLNVPDLGAIAPGALYTDAAEVAEFAAALRERRDDGAQRRAKAVADIGLVREPGAARRLWEATAVAPR